MLLQRIGPSARAERLASALVAVVAGGLLAGACVQSQESPPIDAPRVETTDDDGDFGGDPDVGGSVGSAPAKIDRQKVSRLLDFDRLARWLRGRR